MTTHDPDESWGADTVRILVTGRRLTLLGLALTAATSLAGARPALSSSTPTYVGHAACTPCHAEQVAAWQGSDHERAMQEANAHTVLGDFSGVEFRHGGVSSRFFKRGGKFMVRTDGPDGRLADFEIGYTFGVRPLQQYLIGFPGGRLQALGIAWDSRPRSDGGQRWFHLYPNEKVDHTDALHWTSLYQNWALQCAACHSTNLHKGYDAATNAYRTTYSSINVSCEACHGPGSRHVEWAEQAKPPYAPDDGKGLLVSLRSRWNQAWRLPAVDAPSAVRDQPAPATLMNVCWPCHARRSTIAEDRSPGAPLEDAHRPALLTPPLYHPDGQQRDEVYTWGSFLQSKMYQRGVTCMDCHEPHALKMRAEGNALCTRCHNATVFDTTKHHFHAAGTKGAQCVECHMPAQRYMVVDPRRDHGIRVPRPDLSTTLGSPNACTTCHADRKPEWAAAAMDTWYGKTWRDRPQYGQVLHAATTEGAKALPALLELARTLGSPAVVRATAAALARPQMRPALLPSVQTLLADADPTVRVTGLSLLEPLPPDVRMPAAVALLGDPVRGVRIEAARVLADVPSGQFPADQRAARDRALQEYVDSLRLDADWPTGNANLGNLYLRQGRTDEAVAAYERALSLDPRFAPAYANLADAYRQLGREDEVARVLRRGLSTLPRAADLHHALGLALVRGGDKTSAVKELATATALAPDDARYAYVYAVGLDSTGERGKALAVLRAADARHPYDIDILGALVSMNRDAGDPKAALGYARKLAEVVPDSPEVKRLVAELEAPR